MPVAKLEFTDEGPHGATTVVLLHGFPFSRTLWDETAAHLVEKNARVVRPDLRGHGESPIVNEPATLERCCEDLDELLKGLAAERVWLVGHSYGGYIALEFAKRSPKKLAGLGLVCTRATPDTDEAKRGRDQMIQKIQDAGDVAPLVEAMHPKLCSAVTKQKHPELVERVRQMMLRTPPNGAVHALEGIRDRPDNTPSLSKITARTLIVAGAEDPITPPDGSVAMNKAIPGSQLRIVTGAAHLVMLEAPQVLHHFLDDWLNPSPATTTKAVLRRPGS